MALLTMPTRSPASLSLKDVISLGHVFSSTISLRWMHSSAQLLRNIREIPYDLERVAQTLLMTFRVTGRCGVTSVGLPTFFP
jgi:hypothetical protein